MTACIRCDHPTDGTTAARAGVDRETPLRIARRLLGGNQQAPCPNRHGPTHRVDIFDRRHPLKREDQLAVTGERAARHAGPPALHHDLLPEGET